MKKVVKSITVIMTILYLLLIPLNALASVELISAATPSSADTALLTRWKSLGLLDKSITSGDLNQPIQKIDFVVYINKIFNSVKEAEIGFSDLPKSSWYGKEVARAVAAGFVANKDKTAFKPFDSISRLDAAVMVAHVFGLELKDEKILNKITDGEKLDRDQLEAFGAVIEKGYLAEISGGRYVPSGVLKLIDAMRMLDKCIGQVITKAGTYTADSSGNLLVNASAVTLKGLEVSGDLIICEGVSEGTVNLDGVTIRGKMIIKGGGPNSIYIKNTVLDNDLILEKYSGNVRVVAQGTTTVYQTVLRSGGKLYESGLTGNGGGFVNVSCEKAVAVNQKAVLEGVFADIKLNDSNINVDLNGKANNINISKASTSCFTLLGGSAGTITTLAPKGSIVLSGGTAATVNTEAGSKGNRIDINGSTTIGAINLKDTTAINFDKGMVEKLNVEPSAGGSLISMKKDAYVKNALANGASVFTGQGRIENAYVYANNVSMDIKPGGVYIANGITASINGTVIDPTKPDVKISVISQIDIAEGETRALNVTRIDPNNSNLAYVSSNNSVAAINDRGEVTGISTGTTSVHVTADYTGYNTAVADVKVNVTSSNVTKIGSLTVSPSAYEAGAIFRDGFEILYTAGDNMSNGTVVIRLPAGFSVTSADTCSINGGEEKVLDASQRPDIQTIAFSNLNLTQGQTIKVILKDLYIPAGNTYEFVAISDADGTGPKLPTSGQEKAVFTADSLKKLVEGYNYSKIQKPESYGTTGGSIKLSGLSFIGITNPNELKWLIKVQDDAFAAPKFDDVLTEAPDEFIAYGNGQDIRVKAGQVIRLAVVDKTNNKLKAYADIVVNGDWIRPDDAGKLVAGTNYNNPISGVKANAVRIDGLHPARTDTHWMIKVQDNAAGTVYIDTVLAEGKAYTEGDDIDMTAYQTPHIILAEVDASDRIKAYADITVDKNIISKPADLLQVGYNFSNPAFGSVTGTTMFEILDKGSFAIEKWMVVVQNKDAVKPGLNASITEYERYTEKDDGTPNPFSVYSKNPSGAWGDIPVTAGQHVMLVGVSGAANLIKAYVDLTIDGSQIRQSDAALIPAENIGAPEMGTVQGTTRFPALTISGLSGVTKFMYKVQNAPLASVPQLDSQMSGSEDCVANQNIKVTAEQHVILLATDNSGRIKAYADIKILGTQIRPNNATELSIDTQYKLPQPGTAEKSTKIVLSSTGIQGFKEWRYTMNTSDAAIEIPYRGSKLGGTPYTSGADIPDVSVGQIILITAVDENGATLAYVKLQLTFDQIKRPPANELKSNLEVSPDESYNYSVPEPGQQGGTTKIATLSTMGLDTETTKWLYKISSQPATVPQFNTTMTDPQLQSYSAETSVKAEVGQWFMLYATDRYNKVKAYKNIQLKIENIRTPEAYKLTTPTNYSVPSAGSVPGTTRFVSLSFAGLGDESGLKWMYAVGGSAFNIPGLDTTVSAIDLEKDTDGNYRNISITYGQFILLLATDSTGKIKGYANVNVPQSSIRPYDADLIDPKSYKLVKGTSEGTTMFKPLDLIGIVDATGWMVKTQQNAFEVPGKNIAVTGAAPITPEKNIAVTAGWHILLMATDGTGRVKAYADVVATEDVIMAPFARPLILNENYTNPEMGNAPGTTRIMLDPKNIPVTSGSSIVWKYRTGAQSFPEPHMDDSAAGSEYKTYHSLEDIPVTAGNVILVVAADNDKIKAFRQFSISASQIRPEDAPELVENKNYTGPVAGSRPGTTKLNDLKLIGVSGADGWQIRVASEPAILTLDSVFTTPVNYESGANIQVKLNQYVVLAAVDGGGKVKAYKNIRITELGTQLNPPLAESLTAGLNYASPKFGTLTGTTSMYVSPEGINGFKDFVVKIVNSETDITADSILTYTTNSAIEFTDYSNYNSYISGRNIAANAGQWILLAAVDRNGKVLAYGNIRLTAEQVRPGDAVKLKTPDNYSLLQPGSGIGTTRFSELYYLGIPGLDEGRKWIVKVQDSDLTAPPLMDSSVEDASVYTVTKDINVKAGQFVILYAVDSMGRIKGYINLRVNSTDVRGVAPELTYGTNYSKPVPGSEMNTTKFETLNKPTDEDTSKWVWKYIVQDNAAGTLLKDSLLTGLTPYTQGSNITAAENRHLILVLTDEKGYLKAYADIKITSEHLKNVVASMAGTMVSAPAGEADIAAGGRTVIVSLDIAEWQDNIITDATRRNMLFDGFAAAGDEAVQWGKVIAALKAEGQSAAALSTNKKTITITLSEAVTYDIAKTQEITLTIKPDLIKNAVKEVTAVNKLKIAADVKAQLDGTAVTGGLSEGDVVAGGKTIVINLINGEFAPDVASVKEKREALFDGLQFSNNVTQGALIIKALKDAGANPLNRNSSNKVTITLPPVPAFDISTNETITVKVPYRITSGTGNNEILVGAIKDAVASNQVMINARFSADLSGTLLQGKVPENSIVLGGRTLIITLTDGQWVNDIESDKTKREALFGGLTASSEASEWQKVVNALKTVGQAAIERQDNNTVMITLPQTTGYNITNNQFVVMTVPATCIIGAKANLIAGQTIEIERSATAALSGTAYGTSVNETAIRAGGRTIVITLTNAKWVDDITTNKEVQEELFKGFTTDVEAAQWNKVVEAMTGSAVITRTGTAGTAITITLPAVNGYDITVPVQNIALAVPTCAAIGSSFAIQSVNSLTISSTPPTAAKVIQVSGPTGAYKLGDIIEIKVTFDQEVAVITNGSGNATISLETGSVDRTAEYTRGSGTRELIFTYTVQAGDISPRLAYKSASITLSGTTLQNAGTSVKASASLPQATSDMSLYGSYIMVDALAPKFASGYPKAGTTDEHGVNILVKADEKSKVYFVALPGTTASAPDADAIVREVVTGSAITGAVISAGMKGAAELELNTEATISVADLVPFTEYLIYTVAVDSLGNKGTVASVKVKTTDKTPPVFEAGYPVQTAERYDSQAKILIRTNEVGTVYAVALPWGSPEPTSAQVKAFKNAAGAAATGKGSISITQGAIDVPVELILTGLSVSSQYDVYVAGEDASLNLMAAPAKTTAYTSQLSLSNVGIDLARSILTNTTAKMEYSLDDMAWKACSEGSTGFTYDDGAEILTVYLREAANTANKRMLDLITRTDRSVIDVSKIDYDIAAKKITNASQVNLQYRINGGAWAALNASAVNVTGTAVNVEFVPGPLEVRAAATQNKLPSSAVSVDVIAVPMVAPQLKYNDDQNVIYGLNAAYEYRVDDAAAWKTGATEGEFSGTRKVEIRERATKERLPSEIQTISFTAGLIKVAAYPVTADKVLKKNFITITFEEKTNKAYLSSAADIADMIRQYVKVGKWNTAGNQIETRSLGSDFSAQWNTTGDAITIVYNSLLGATVKIGDEVRINPAAGIKNAAGTSDSYESKGILTGSFHSVPALVSIKAVNSGNQIGFGSGDSIVLTFDQPTKATTFRAAEIGTYLKITDSTGKSKNEVWSSVTADSSIKWNGAGTVLTITFDHVTGGSVRLLPGNDKITVSPLLGLTDADETTEASNSSAFISGSFTPPVEINSVVLSNGGLVNSKNVGDKITITFNQPTNRKAITASMLINYFKLYSADMKTAHSWGVQSNSGIKWESDTVLTIVLSSISGLTLAPHDILVLDPLAGIKDKDDGTAACDSSCEVTGSY